MKENVPCFPYQMSPCGNNHHIGTVNVDISVQYIFSCISRRTIDAQKRDVSEK